MATKDQIKLFNEKYAKDFDQALKEKYEAEAQNKLSLKNDKITKILNEWQNECDTRL